MDKVKLEWKAPEKKTIEYNGIKIQVDPFLSTAQQGFLINSYLETYFGKFDTPLIKMSEYNYLAAEYALKDYIFQIATSIDIDFDNNFYSDAVLWDKITSEIVNYYDFKEKLDFIVKEVKDQKLVNSQLGNVLSGLLEKVNKIFENITPEEIEKIQKETAALAAKLQEVPVLGTIPAPSEKV